MALRRKHHNTRFDRKRPIEDSALYPYLQRYLTHHQVIGTAKDTLKRRESALRRFIAWCEARAIDDPRSVTKPMLEAYQRHLFYYRKTDGEPLSSGSQHVILSPVKQWFKWLTQENYLLYNPASELQLPKKPKHLPRSVLTIAETRQILETPDLDTAAGLRDRAILEVLYARGMRRAELTAQTTDCIDATRQTVLVRSGEGDKDRYLPLGESALTWLTRYQQDVRPKLLIQVTEPHLFLTDYGEPFSVGYLGHLVKRYIRAAGIDKPGSCHLFRHAMATHMLENGADIRFIQAMLGHADLSTTQIYTQVSVEKLREIHAATHPGLQAEDERKA